MKNEILSCYEQAQKLMQIQFRPSNKIVKNTTIFPNWIKDSSSFWYERATTEGREFRIVNAETAINHEAFDHKLLAGCLSDKIGKTVNYINLPISNVSIMLSPLTVCFKAFDKYWMFESEKPKCEEADQVFHGQFSPFGDAKYFYPLSPMLPKSKNYYLNSPDGKKSIFVRENNLWLEDLATGRASVLTNDGSDENYYGGGLVDIAVPGKWSPDSRYILTAQWDFRQVDPFPSIKFAPVNPSIIPQIEYMKLNSFSGKEKLRLLVIDALTGEVRPIRYPALQQQLLGLRQVGFFRANMAWWSMDSKSVYFFDISLRLKNMRMARWDLQRGTTKVLIEESTESRIKLNDHRLSEPVFLPLPESNELIWFSDRNGWSHLYLYDLTTGDLKHQITDGEWVVRNILHFDHEKRELLLQSASRDKGVSPYYRDICKVNIDSGNLTRLVGGDFDCLIHKYLDFNTWAKTTYTNKGSSVNDEIHGVSPCGKYIVTTRSRVDSVPVSILIDRNGDELMVLETADVSGLPADWSWPESVKLRSSDGKTDIYGVIFRPPGFNKEKLYPIIEYSANSRNLSSMPQGSFDNNAFAGAIYFRACSLAALGFIVVTIEGRGTPMREKKFCDHHYGNFYRGNDFEDRIVGIKQLAERYPYMDITRVGLVSNENSTNAVYALLRHSDFYKVAVLHCFYDPRFGFGQLNEMNEDELQGRTEKINPEDFVDTFSGKLLLTEGLRSPLAIGAFRLTDALQQANKDFDMICLPNGINNITAYLMRREWDYLVTHLHGKQPPVQFDLKTSESLVVSSAEFLKNKKSTKLSKMWIDEESET